MITNDFASISKHYKQASTAKLINPIVYIPHEMTQLNMTTAGLLDKGVCAD